MNTCWALNTWAVDSWAANSWAEAIEGAAESLGLGDLTTAFAQWLRTVGPDVTTNIRDRLAAHYSVAQPADNTTLVSRFLANRA